MNKNEFILAVKKNFNINNIDSVIEKIDKYIVLLNEYNNKFNLTRLNKDEIIYSQYFYETLIPYINFDFTNIVEVLDIGSGSGIPGIVLKIFFSHIHLTIIESNQKKCDFLKILVEELNLENVNIVCNRAENCKNQFKEYFDLVTCRAVASLKILLELSFPLTKINGKIILPKSINYLDELKEARNIINLLEATNYQIVQTDYNQKKFNTFIFNKFKKTPLIFPRPWKEIIK